MTTPRRASSFEEADHAPWAGRIGEASVARDQVAVEDLSQCHVDGVVRGDIGAQLVASADQRECWIAINVDRLQILNRRGEAPVRDRASHPSFAEHGDGFHVDQIGSGDLPGRSRLSSGSPTIGSVVTYDVRQDRGVNDDQACCRSLPRSSTA